jgi:hypothetical protein
MAFIANQQKDTIMKTYFGLALAMLAGAAVGAAAINRLNAQGTPGA